MTKRIIKAVGKRRDHKVSIDVTIETGGLTKQEADRRYQWTRNRVYSMLAIDFDNSEIKIK